MTEQDKILGLALELNLLRTQIILAFYPCAMRAEVDIIIANLKDGLAEVISFYDTQAKKHTFHYNNELNHYKLIEEFEV